LFSSLLLYSLSLSLSISDRCRRVWTVCHPQSTTARTPSASSSKSASPTSTSPSPSHSSISHSKIRFSHSPYSILGKFDCRGYLVHLEVVSVTVQPPHSSEPHLLANLFPNDPGLELPNHSTHFLFQGYRTSRTNPLQNIPYPLSYLLNRAILRVLEEYFDIVTHNGIRVFVLYIILFFRKYVLLCRW
jgi:hypothetical protein